jgi:CBS domain-containing protein
MFFDTVADLLQAGSTQSTHSVSPATSVAVAVALMNEHGIGAVLVVDDSRLAGILTERDVLRRLIATGRGAATIAAQEIMTTNPETVSPRDLATEALERMTRGGFRHLPVVDHGELRGILSMRDLNDWMMNELRVHADGALMAVKALVGCADPRQRISI